MLAIKSNPNPNSTPILGHHNIACRVCIHGLFPFFRGGGEGQQICLAERKMNAKKKVLISSCFICPNFSPINSIMKVYSNLNSAPVLKFEHLELPPHMSLLPKKFLTWGLGPVGLPEKFVYTSPTPSCMGNIHTCRFEISEISWKFNFTIKNILTDCRNNQGMSTTVHTTGAVP